MSKTERMERLKKAYLPLSEASFLLLVSLKEENHGYGIMQKVLELTNGRVHLGSGTVYTILYKMENDGLISFTKEIERRKMYRITAEGEEILRLESQRLLELAKIAQVHFNGG